MISLEILRNGQTPSHHVFHQSEILIGRKPDNDIVLEERDVSARHACLRITDGELTITDLGSTNGTYLDGAPVVSAVVGDNAVIQVAGNTLKIVEVRAEVRAEPSPAEAPQPQSPRPQVDDPPLLAETGPPLLGLSDLPPLLSGDEDPPTQSAPRAPREEPIALPTAPPIGHTPVDVLAEPRARTLAATLPQPLAATLPQPLAATLPQPLADRPGPDDLPLADALPQPLAETLTPPLTKALAQPLADTLAQPLADTLAQQLADTLAQPLADALAQPLADALADTLAQPLAEPLADSLAPLLAPFAAAPAPSPGSVDRGAAPPSSASLLATSLLALWEDRTVTQLFARAGVPLRCLRGEVRDEAHDEAVSAEAIRAAVEGLLGPFLGPRPLLHTLEDGSLLTAGVVAGGPWLLLERPSSAFVPLGRRLELGQLEAEAAHRLTRTIARARPLLAYAADEASSIPLLVALMAAEGRRSCLLRHPREPIALPSGTLAIDLQAGELAPTLRLVRASRPDGVIITGSIAGEEALVRALVADGIAVLVAIRADTIEAAGLAASALGWAEGPSIAYAAALEIGSSTDGAAHLRSIIELSGDNETTDDTIQPEK